MTCWGWGAFIYTRLHVCIHPGNRLALGGCLSHQRQERKPLLGSLSSKVVENNSKMLGLSLSKQLGNILIWLLSKRVALKWSWLLSGQRSRVAVADKSCWAWVAHVGLTKAGSYFLCVCLQISIIKAIKDINVFTVVYLVTFISYIWNDTYSFFKTLTRFL